MVLFVNLAANVTYAALNVSLTVIGKVLDADAVHLPEAYVVGVACVVALTPGLLSAWGAPRTLEISLWGLMATSALAALSPGVWVLGLALFLHGLFAAPVLPLTQALCAGEAADEAQRARLGSYWVATSLLAATAGYLCGGWVTDHAGWRWALVLCWMPALLALPRVRRRASLAAGKTADSTLDDRRERAPLDVAGGVLFALVLLSLTALLALGSGGALRVGRGLLRVVLAVGLAAAAFLTHQRRVPHPILDLSILTDTRVAGALICTFILDASSTGIFQAEMLGEVLHLDAEWLALRSSLGGAAMLLGVGLTNRLLQRATAPVAAVAALAILVTGKAGFLEYDPGVSIEVVLWPALVSSVGYGMLMTVLAVNACQSSDVRRSAAAGALYAVATQVGASAGLASLDALLHRQMATQVAHTQGVLTHAYDVVFVSEAALALLVLPFLLLLRGPPQRQNDGGVP